MEIFVELSVISYILTQHSYKVYYTFWTASDNYKSNFRHGAFWHSHLKTKKYSEIFHKNYIDDKVKCISNEMMLQIQQKCIYIFFFGKLIKYIENIYLIKIVEQMIRSP